MQRTRALALIASASCGLTLAALQGCWGRPRVAFFHNLGVIYKLTLPSGEQVTINDAHGDSFVDVDKVQRHIYYISYETAHDFEDLPALRQEALRVWAAYLPQIVGADYDSAVVTAEKTDDAGDEEGRPVYLKRMADGTWQLQ